MLWVLKRTVPIDDSFEHHKHIFKLDGKENNENFTLKKFVLTRPMRSEFSLDVWHLDHFGSMVLLCAESYFEQHFASTKTTANLNCVNTGT